MLNWKLAFKNKNFIAKFVVSFMFLFAIMYFFAWFLNYIEQRQGHVFYDPVLNFFRPRDVSDIIFYVTYGASLIGLVYAFASPFRTIHLCQMYTLLTIFRIITLFIIPLDPPSTIIPLRDSILQNTFYNEAGNVKDLFFSGHTATMFLFFFFTKHRVLKWFFFICALSVAVAVVLQHVHYSYDVIVAPLFAFFAYRLVSKHSKLYETGTKDLPQLF
ncbi:MAG TPA: phosphatase PAP2-related protein [Bacteroidia bacterium]